MNQNARQNRHRLLHTLVFASALALDGCGSQATSAPAVAQPRAADETSSGAATARRTNETEAAVVATPSPSPSSAPSAPVASASAPLVAGRSSSSSSSSASLGTMPSSSSGAAPETLIAASDVRYCEVGWPTTKGGRSRPTCTTTVLEDGTTSESCTDRSGPCVRRPE